ncbi:ultraviolet-B receptor UVR8 [Pelomyxa schiedti]|nr:ultraviolet-B receptor UVR8 [Pelomyxa schiedti]
MSGVTTVGNVVAEHQRSTPTAAASCTAKKKAPPRTVFAWGGGRSGELGHAGVDREGVCAFPARVPGLPDDVSCVVCGEAYTAALTDSGKLYTWGSTRGGKLGTVTQEVQSRGGDVCGTPTLVSSLSSMRVTQISCGENHMACITEPGFAWSWGKGTHGCLASGAVKDRWIPGPVLLDGKHLQDVVQIQCGYIFSGAICQGGSLLMWGTNSYGQLGIGSSVPEVHNPTHVEGLPPVKELSLGSLYAGAVTVEGAIYTWGYGGYGNLGLGSRVSHNRPALVKGLSEVKVKTVHCAVGQINPATGGDVVGHEGPHTVAVSEDGSLYTWGTCHKGILGNMYNKTLISKGDQLVPYRVGSKFWDCPEQGDSNYLKGVCVVQALASSIHTAALSSDGNVYCWGCGSTGRMGVRKYMTGLSGGRSRMKCYIMVPTIVEELAEKEIFVTQISTSRHTMACVGYHRAKSLPPAQTASDPAHKGRTTPETTVPTNKTDAQVVLPSCAAVPVEETPEQAISSTNTTEKPPLETENSTTATSTTEAKPPTPEIKPEPIKTPTPPPATKKPTTTVPSKPVTKPTTKSTTTPASVLKPATKGSTTKTTTPSHRINPQTKSNPPSQTKPPTSTTPTKPKITPTPANKPVSNTTTSTSKSSKPPASMNAKTTTPSKPTNNKAPSNKKL